MIISLSVFYLFRGKRHTSTVDSFLLCHRTVQNIRKNKKPKRHIFILAIILIILVICICFANYYNLLPRKSYTSNDFDIATLYSEVDFNNNGIDDYTDILLGARKDAENRPKYDGSYYDGGYPPDNIGVYTAWEAFLKQNTRGLCVGW